MALGIYQAACWFLGLCYEVEVIGPLLCRRLLDVVLLVLLSVLLLSNLVAALGSFFLAPDLELLVSAPIPPRTLFGARFAEQLYQSSWMVLAFGLPVLLAFARVAGAAPSYLAIAAVVPALLVLPAALGTTLTLLLVRFFPAARVRDLVVALVFIAFVVLYILSRVLEPERFVNPDGFASMVSFLASFSAPSSPLLPSHWATTVIGVTFRDEAGRGGAALALAALWTGMGSAYVVCGWAFRRWYSRAFSRSQQSRGVARLSRLWARLRGTPLPREGPIRPPGRRGARVDALRLVGVLTPRGPLREFLIKDLKLILRDPAQWSQWVLLLALVFVYLYNFRYFRSMGDAGMVGRLALYLIGMGLSGFVTAAVSVRFAFPLVSLEGRTMWLLKSAPLRPRQILGAKVASTLPALVVVAEVMAIASCVILGAEVELIALAAAVAGLVAVSVATIGTGLGALLPDFRAETAAKVAASFGGLVCMTISVAVASLLVACAVYPAYLLYYQRAARPLVLMLCAGGALLTTTISVVVPLWLGTKALQRSA
jgi:ABC-2 type transport system permease protein